MSHVVFTVRADLSTFAAAVDAARGIPINGVRMGSGIHCPPADARTTRHQGYLQHRTLPRWAYLEDPAVLEAEGRVPIPATGTRQTLDATWNDASRNFSAKAEELE